MKRSNFKYMGIVASAVYFYSTLLETVVQFDTISAAFGDIN